jgi:hypothetical protein
MREQVHVQLDAEDVAAGRMKPEEVLPYSEDGLVTIAPNLRALFLGWERALVEDQRARNLTEEQAAAETETLAEGFKTVMGKEMRGDYFEEKIRCEDLLIPVEISGGVTARMTEALDPADIGTAGFRPDGPVIDEANRALCLGQAEMARLVVGAGALDSETRFYRLRRARDGATYDGSLVAAFGAASAHSSKDFDVNFEDDRIETREEMDTRFKKAAERRAERQALCASYN